MTTSSPPARASESAIRVSAARRSAAASQVAASRPRPARSSTAAERAEVVRERQRPHAGVLALHLEQPRLHTGGDLVGEARSDALERLGERLPRVREVEEDAALIAVEERPVRLVRRPPERALEGGRPDRAVHGRLDLRRRGADVEAHAAHQLRGHLARDDAPYLLVMQRIHRAIRERVAVHHRGLGVEDHAAEDGQQRAGKAQQPARHAPSRGALRARRARPSARRRPCTPSRTWTSRCRPSGSCRPAGGARGRTRRGRRAP